MTVIGTNIGALRAANASNSASMALQTSMERLSTGKRINSSKDDAAGLAIASTMTSGIRGMNQAVRNANDGMSMAQTAEGALDEVTNMMQRIRELAVQAASGTYSTTDVTNIKSEVGQLQKQITAIKTNTTFNGIALFTGTAGAAADGKVAIQTGSDATDTVELSFDELDVTDIVDPTLFDDPSAALGTVTTALQGVATQRAALGGQQSRLQSVVNNLTTNVANLTEARSRIEDTDFSSETAALAKAQILSQASTAMLAQANQSQQSVLSLLR